MVNFGFNLTNSGQQPNLFQLVIPVLVVNFHFHHLIAVLATTLMNEQVNLLTWTW
jgi:hypothetical protein